MSYSLWPHGLSSPWNSPGLNTGVGSLSLLQGIFPTQGLNPCLPHCRQIFYQLSHKVAIIHIFSTLLVYGIFFICIQVSICKSISLFLTVAEILDIYIYHILFIPHKGQLGVPISMIQQGILGGKIANLCIYLRFISNSEMVVSWVTGILHFVVHLTSLDIYKNLFFHQEYLGDYIFQIFSKPWLLFYFLIQVRYIEVKWYYIAEFTDYVSSAQFSCSVLSDSLRPHDLQHTRPPCPSPTPGVHSDSRPSHQRCHPAISSSVVPFSSCPQSLPASVFPMSQLFAWGGQSTGVSALVSFLPKKAQGWSPSERTGWISLQSKGLSRVFSNTTVQKHQFFGAQLSSQSNSHIHTWPLEKP